MKLTAQELRIGNLVERMDVVGDKFYLPICRINSDGFVHVEQYQSTVSCYLSEINPIPLTEEWLKKFGFEKVDDEWTNIKCIEFGVYVDQQELSHVWDGAFTGSPMQFVHQLQNLYFALTGSELTLNTESK
jgi:hypothetical protein